MTYEDCTGEEIAITGEIHYNVMSSTDKDGVYHFDALVTIRGKGTGLTSGNEYVFAYTQRTNYDLGVIFCDPEGINRAPYVEDQTYRALMISKGSLPNSYYEFKVRWAFDENCNFTEEIIDSKLDCRGVGGSVGSQVAAGVRDEAPQPAQ